METVTIYGIMYLGIIVAYITFCITVYVILNRRYNERIQIAYSYVDKIREELYRRKYMITNEKSLEQLLIPTTEDKHYEEFLDVFINLLQKKYKEYQFQLGKPAEDDYISGYNLAFIIHPQEHPDEHEELFRLAVNYSLDIDHLNELFVERVKTGDVVELGDDIVISEEGTGTTTILQGGTVQAFINFRTTEEVEKSKEQETKEEEERKKEREELKKKQEARKEAYDALREATKALEEVNSETKERFPELPETVKRAQNAFKELLDD